MSHLDASRKSGGLGQDNQDGIKGQPVAVIGFCSNCPKEKEWGRQKTVKSSYSCGRTADGPITEECGYGNIMVKWSVGPSLPTGSSLARPLPLGGTPVKDQWYSGA